MHCNEDEVLDLDGKQDYLEHYGRLGMKWYQHKFGDADGRAEYAKKGLARMRKADYKSQPAHRKADVAAAKAKQAENKSRALQSKFFFRLGPIDDYRERRLYKKAFKAQKKASKAERKAAKMDKKVQKTARFLNRYLSDVNLSDISAEDIAVGEKYCVQLLKNMR